MLIYISGAIRNNPNYQVEFQKAEQWLMLKDYTPINPARFITNFPKLTEEQIMKIDYCLLEMCDGIFMLGGWQNSKGACAELSYAKSLGKKVLYQDYFKDFKKAKKIENTFILDANTTKHKTDEEIAEILSRVKPRKEIV